MNKKFCALDIEIVKEIPEGEDWKQHIPLGVSCAATICSREITADVWYPRKGSLFAPGDVGGAMNEHDISGLTQYLKLKESQGYEIVTWNGLGFDFQVLYIESKDDYYKQVAKNHIDIMYHILCVKGFPLGLDAVAKGLKLAGKTEGMHGDLAPKMWAEGIESRKKVLEYVAQDAVTTLQVAEALDNNYGTVTWISKAGRYNSFQLRNLLPVKDTDTIPLPDTSWMTAPRSREEFLGWLYD